MKKLRQKPTEVILKHLTQNKNYQQVSHIHSHRRTDAHAPATACASSSFAAASSLVPEPEPPAVIWPRAARRSSGAA